MKVPEQPVSYDEIKFNLDNGIMEVAEQMLEKQEEIENDR